MELTWWQWLLAGLASFIVGFSKTGVAGIGILAVALYSVVLPTKISPGIVLPMLIAGDIVAVASYRRHAQMQHLVRLMPAAVVGILVGYFAMKRIDASAIGPIIGGILLLMVAVHLWRRTHPETDAKASETHSLLLTIGVGLLAGFTTMVANAAGPIMVLYLLAMRLPKLEFMGTGAWYFFSLNSFKVPFQYDLGNINAQTLLVNVKLLPMVLIGAFLGRKLLPHIDEKTFENLALILTVAAAIKLFF